jgi:hypothetical protein
MSRAFELSVGARSGLVRATNGSKCRSERSRSAMTLRARRSSGAGRRYTSDAATPSSRTSRSRTWSSMSSSTSRRTGGPKRRRVSSRSSAVSRFSASSSSTSRSSLRVTRKVKCSRISMPGNRWSRCAAMTSSSGTNLVAYMSASGDSSALSATRSIRGSTGGTLTRAKCSLPVRGLTRTTARFRERPEMYGNGCAGSTASGVSTGNTRLVNISPMRSCSSGESSSQRTIVMPSVARAGRTWSRYTRACIDISSDATSEICSSTSRGSRPDADRTAMPVAIRRLRPATRTMKNSSRLDPKIAR